jgi:PqqD family protein of HPr-rel-A system
MDRYGRADGVLVESVGHLWAGFSPLSGETTLLNDECAAILEVLESGASDTSGVCAALAQDGGVDAHQFVAAVENGWARLLDAGLVIRLRDATAAGL